MLPRNSEPRAMSGWEKGATVESKIFHLSLVNRKFNFEMHQWNWLSLQRSEMFIAMNAPKRIFAPVGAKPASRAIAWPGKSCAPPELRTKENDHQAINISP
ncbi:MAG TPA: hypothetical protein DC047_10020, partial [Blastocatellia bacterium]|nr:hypothetical protein [Blastocatellia bacterium]